MYINTFIYFVTIFYLLKNEIAFSYTYEKRKTDGAVKKGENSRKNGLV
jgi:hypothetical protein